MKKAFFTLFSLFISLNFFAQASFTATGIAVQGIARDANNSAYKNQNITLDFEFFSKTDAGAENATFSAISKQVVTDNFGVFSTIIDPTFENNSVFANQKVWLRITNKEDSRIIQESQLMHVPYAISANNGVPTGAIMPFIGDENSVPEGWLLCDGASIPTNTATEKLRTLLGDTKTPKLTGRFLKGSGTPTEAKVVAIPLKGYQNMEHTMPNHNHEKGSLNASTSGSAHKHAVPMQYLKKFDSDSDEAAFTGGSSNTDTKTDGAHEHAISGETGNAKNYAAWHENRENRPSSFGVNYIIKI